VDRVARDGYDTYALDLRGYGGSTRPPAMSQPPEANAPFARTHEALRDISAAVDFILARRAVKQLTLIGWSWGTTTTAAYAARNPEVVIADWASAIRPHADLLAGDGIHPGDSGGRIYATAVAQAIDAAQLAQAQQRERMILRADRLAERAPAR